MRKPTKRIGPVLIWTAVLSLFAWTVFQLIKHVVTPNINIYLSHVLTIVVGTIAAVIVAYFTMRWLERYEARSREERQKAELAEEAAIGSREIAKAVIENTATVMVFLSPDHKIIELNQEAENICGQPKSEALGKDFLELFMPADGWADISTTLHKALVNSETYVFDHKVVTPDGKKKVFSWSAGRFLDHKGEPAGIILAGLDITERRLAEEELKQSYARNEALLQALPDIVFVIDRNGVYRNVRVSEEAKSLIPEEQYQDRKMSDVLPPELARRTKYYLDRTLASGKMQNFEYDFASNGETHNYEARMTPLGREQVIAVISDITNRKQAEAALDTSYRVQTILNSLLRMSLAEMPLAEQLQKAIDIILSAPFMPLRPEGGIFLATDNQELILTATRNLDPALISMCGRVPFGNCLCGRVAASGRMIFSQPGDPRHTYSHKGMTPHGHYIVPIKSQAQKGRTLGVIVLYISPDHPQKEAEERFLRATADTLAGIIERQKARDAIAASERRYRTLAESSPDLIFIIDRSARMQYVNEVGAKRFGQDAKNLINQPLAALFPKPATRFMEDKLQQAFSSKQPESFEQSIMFAAEEIWLDTRFIPLGFNGQPTHVMGISRDISERRETETLSRSLNMINMMITSTLDIDRIMTSVTRELTVAIGGQSAVIAMRSEDYWEIKYVFGQLPADLIGRRIPLRQAMDLELAADSQSPLVVDIAEDKEIANGWTKPFLIRSYLGVPLTAKEQRIGVMAVFHHGVKDAFRESQIDFATKAAVSISLAWDNARLFAHEHNIAETLQNALLTMPSEIKGISLSHLYRSATREAAEVGGDFYDAFDLGNNRIALMIGDVSGKGLEAATLTSLVKNTIKAFAYTEDSPAEVMTRANDVVTESAPSSIFISVFFAILNTKTGELRYCAAGHPPAIVKYRTGAIDILMPDSPVIGVFKNMDFSEKELRLQKEDTLILYTDGVIEARHEKEFFGEERLFDLIRAGKAGIPQQNVADIFDAVMSFTKGNLTDDMALLAISLMGEPEQY